MSQLKICFFMLGLILSSFSFSAEKGLSLEERSSTLKDQRQKISPVLWQRWSGMDGDEISLDLVQVVKRIGFLRDEKEKSSSLFFSQGERRLTCSQRLNDIECRIKKNKIDQNDLDERFQYSVIPASYKVESTKSLIEFNEKFYKNWYTSLLSSGFEGANKHLKILRHYHKIISDSCENSLEIIAKEMSDDDDLKELGGGLPVLDSVHPPFLSVLAFCKDLEEKANELDIWFRFLMGRTGSCRHGLDFTFPSSADEETLNQLVEEAWDLVTQKLLTPLSFGFKLAQERKELEDEYARKFSLHSSRVLESDLEGKRLKFEDSKKEILEDLRRESRILFRYELKMKMLQIRLNKLEDQLICLTQFYYLKADEEDLALDLSEEAEN